MTLSVCDWIDDGDALRCKHCGHRTHLRNLIRRCRATPQPIRSRLDVCYRCDQLTPPGRCEAFGLRCPGPRRYRAALCDPQTPCPLGKWNIPENTGSGDNTPGSANCFSQGEHT